ncbi:MAG TPA: hypothetical protein VHX60_08480 [Acidobacteriaceae bacterium]|nr:hypothetical protein [Acidobacteriaceae bacterium]
MCRKTVFLVTGLAALFVAQAFAAPDANDTAGVSAQWRKVERKSKTTPTTQILAHAYTLRNDPMHDPEFAALRDLGTNDTRLQLWFSVTRQAVAELKAPTATETSWDFTWIDPLVEDYYNNTTGKHHINMGTIPRWMFNVPDEEVPINPAASFYAYTDGTTGALLKDPSGKQFADYQVRLYQWLTKGGFKDELGKYHKSGHHYKIDNWGVLNEPDFENHITVEQYTKIWDAVATAIHKVDRHVQFFSAEVSGAEIPWAQYFLDVKNHAPGAPPVRYFCIHNYTNGNNDPSTWHDSYFVHPDKNISDGASANAFGDRVREVMKIRGQLSPKTTIMLDELGIFDLVKPGEESCRADEPYSAYDPLYWNANGANWVDTFITAENLGVPLISMSQFDGYATQCPSISMMDGDSRKPNAHYWDLYLISHNFGPGDKLVATQSTSADVVAQGSVTSGGRKLLLINTQDHPVAVSLAGAFPSGSLRADVVDQQSGEQPPRTDSISGAQLTLAPFAVAVVSQQQ